MLIFYKFHRFFFFLKIIATFILTRIKGICFFFVKIVKSEDFSNNTTNRKVSDLWLFTLYEVKIAGEELFYNLN